ncbi:DUF4276 family protein [Marinomonas sp. THO17]|uniref:DUF4276 family protein n=1 Tax=Marinomonas sp. THO17 TaxID=3149048 RepID=UPI00336BC045
MVRIGISVEGSTEERFVKRVLGQYLATKGIYMTPISMGGDVNVERAKNELKKIANNFDFVTTLYDFYGFKKRLDGESKEDLENRLMDSAHEAIRSKFIPYVQMYEFEGLLFSCPESMERGLNESGVQQWCQNVLAEFNDNPESINNSVETAPSKRLLKHTKYRKTTHGPNIAAEIGIPKMREMCIGFHEWLCKIENLV